MKRFLSLILALLVSGIVCAPVWAAEELSVNVSDGDTIAGVFRFAASGGDALSFAVDGKAVKTQLGKVRFGFTVNGLESGGGAIYFENQKLTDLPNSSGTHELEFDQSVLSGESIAITYVPASEEFKYGKKPVYAYVFDRQQPGDDNPGVPHSCDNRYQFGTLDGSWRPYTQEDWALAEKMQKYWANFARTGDPNGEGLEPWLPYTEDKLAIRLAVDGCTMTDYNEVTGGKLEKLEAELLSVFEK